MEALEFLANVTAYSIILYTAIEVIVTIFTIIVFIWIILGDIF